MPTPSESRYSLNSPAVASQLIDGETILIHFERGRYYSVGGLGCELFEQLIGCGRSADRLVELLSAQFEIPRDAAEQTIHRYVQDLVDEELIVTSERQASLDDVDSEFRFSSAVFKQPVIEKHTELEDLLKLDPLHDVDDSGWPSVSTATTEKQA